MSAYYDLPDPFTYTIEKQIQSWRKRTLTCLFGLHSKAYRQLKREIARKEKHLAMIDSVINRIVQMKAVSQEVLQPQVTVNK